jgi:hypothetical protein
LKGKDLTQLPLPERREILNKVAPVNDHASLSAVSPGLLFSELLMGWSAAFIPREWVYKRGTEEASHGTAHNRHRSW